MNTSTVETPLSVSITSSFHIPTEQLSSLDRYYVLYWQARYLYASLLRSPRIVRESVPYVPVLQELTMEYLGKNPEANVRLSFRRLKGKRSGYVIIRPTCTVSATHSRKIGS